MARMCVKRGQIYFLGMKRGQIYFLRQEGIDPSHSAAAQKIDLSPFRRFSARA